MKTHLQPLAEVFGYLITDQSNTAKRSRSRRLCPFNNGVPNCTKDKAKNPLGTCSVFHRNDVVITCPIRFRQDWIIADHAAEFFFAPKATWTSLIEVRLNDRTGRSAGNIDIVLAAYDQAGRIYDFGALEVQAVYISGNVRDPFRYYMKNPKANQSMDWSNRPNYPRPDYLSSSRKRLAPQLLFKGGILSSWNKRMAVALSKGFFNTLPPLKRTKKELADVAWMIYDMRLEAKRFRLERVDTVFTRFETALEQITRPAPGKMQDFLELLQGRLHEQRGTSTRSNTIERPL